MDSLRIRLFGGLEISRGAHALPTITTRNARSLFAYLVLHRGRPMHRDVLCGLLWGEQTDAEARKALRTALWRIRSVLEPDADSRGVYLRVDGPQISFPDEAPAWVDVAAFDAALSTTRLLPAGVLPEGEADGIRQAVALYRGDLLDGFYEDWCCVHRERLRLSYLTALERLLAHHRDRGEWLAAVSAARAILRLDPLREHVHRVLMVCHLSMGDRPSALRQFEACARVMRDELGIEPLDETRALYRSIRDHGTLNGVEQPAQRASVASAALTGFGAASERPLLREVEDALRDLNALVARLEAARMSAES